MQLFKLPLVSQGQKMSPTKDENQHMRPHDLYTIIPDIQMFDV